MKLLFAGIFLVVGCLRLQAQSITTPQLSPTQTIKQNFGIGSMEVSYSRPGLKGRKLGTDLAPYGKVWRTGANAATTIQFTDDVTIGGTSVKAGKYGMLSIPSANEWILIITRDINVNQPALYKQENDVVRVKAPVAKLKDKVETFTMNFANFTNSNCDLQLMWENSAVVLPIMTNADEKVMKQITDVMINDNKPYYTAALYYYENGKDLTKAKEWIDIVSADPANAKALNIFWLKARICQKLKDKDCAKTNAEKTIALAKENKDEEHVKMAEDLMKTL